MTQDATFALARVRRISSMRLPLESRRARASLAGSRPRCSFQFHGFRAIAAQAFQPQICRRGYAAAANLRLNLVVTRLMEFPL